MKRLPSTVFLAAMVMVLSLPFISPASARTHKHHSRAPAHLMHLGVQPPVSRALTLPTLSTAATGLNSVLTALTMNSIADLQLAVALAKSANTTNSNQRAACYAAVLLLVEQQNGIMIATSGLTLAANSAGQVINTGTAAASTLNAPAQAPAAASSSVMAGAAVFSHAEQLAQLVDALQPGSPLMTACSPLATQVKSDMGSLLSTILKGGLSLATFGL